MRAAFGLFLLCGLWLTPARAEDAPPPVEEVIAQGSKLAGGDLPELLSGSTLYGKYTDGRPDWAEQTAVTGQVYDVIQDWKEVGVWGITGDTVCYSYAEGAVDGLRGPYCYDVYEWKGQYYFFGAGGLYLVGYTYRVDRPSLM